MFGGVLGAGLVPCIIRPSFLQPLEAGAPGLTQRMRQLRLREAKCFL